MWSASASPYPKSSRNSASNYPPLPRAISRCTHRHRFQRQRRVLYQPRANRGPRRAFFARWGGTPWVCNASSPRAEGPIHARVIGRVHRPLGLAPPTSPHTFIVGHNHQRTNSPQSPTQSAAAPPHPEPSTAPSPHALQHPTQPPPRQAKQPAPYPSTPARHSHAPHPPSGAA
jgi:hypothetical protein